MLSTEPWSLAADTYYGDGYGCDYLSCEDDATFGVKWWDDGSKYRMNYCDEHLKSELTKVNQQK